MTDRKADAVQRPAARSPDPAADVTAGSRWREAASRQARAVYESAHGNPVSDDARGMRWSLSPRAAATACLVMVVLGAVLLWALRPPGGEMVPAAAPNAVPSEAGGAASTAPGGTAGGEVGADAWGEAADGGTVVVVVDVAGHVVDPGVRELPGGSRVGDAIDAAGGTLPDAARDGPNLARVLVDGEQVYVPGLDDQGGGAAARPSKINVNRADVAALEELPGVGPVLAQRIEDYRGEHGPFTAVEDLEAVSGIGPSLLSQLAEEATV